MKLSRLLGTTATFCGLTFIGLAHATLIDFESILDGQAVNNAYSGVTFQNATVISAGASLNELDLPPFSGVNVAFDDGGNITIVFSSPVNQVSGYFTYIVPVTMTAYDSLMNFVGSYTSSFQNNLALAGDIGSLPNELFQISYAGGIRKIVLAGDTFGGSFVFDDLTYVTSATNPGNPSSNGQIPEPSTAFLVLAGMLGFWKSVFKNQA